MKAKYTLTLILLLLVLSAAACSTPNPTGAPPSATPPPGKTGTVAQPTNAPQVLPPTFTSVPPTASAPLPTRTAVIPTRTASPTTPPSLTFLQLFQPASGSRITSPVKVSGESNSTFEQNLVVAVYDATGRRLALKATTIQAELGKRGAFSAELAFNVTFEQAGRVVVYDTSPAHGGILHLVSAEVTLRPASGKAEILTAKPAPPLLQIFSPNANGTVSGGLVTVTGYGGPIFENQFSARLCGAGGGGTADPVCGTTGNILAQAAATLVTPDAGKSGTYFVQLPYQVWEKTPAWVVVFDHSARDGELIFVNSIPVQLMP